VFGDVSPRLVGLSLTGDVDSWTRVGLVGADGIGQVGSVTLRVQSGVGGIRSWSFSGLDGSPSALDGLAVDHDWTPGSSAHHFDAGSGGWASLDHVVVTTGSLERTVSAFAAAGLRERRRRDVVIGAVAHQQVFFRPGEAIIELVGPVEPTERAAEFWGLTFNAVDLDRLCADLGLERCGAPRDAVQPGRRIATLRSAAGLGIAVAVMSPEVAG
jgi:hypothetical protein